MTNHRELKRLRVTRPEVWSRIEALERPARHSFFPPEYIPTRYCAGRDPKTGAPFPAAADVRRYCMSVYGQCE